jgi:hypothetical protein
MRRTPPYGDLSDSFVPSHGRAEPYRATTATPTVTLGKVTIMHSAHAHPTRVARGRLVTVLVTTAHHFRREPESHALVTLI